MEGSGEQMAVVLREMCEGSVEAFDAFYARYTPLIMGIALRMLGDRMEAEDACHDIFLEALRRGGRYDPRRGSVDAWLAVMTRSRCLDRLRRGKKQVCREEWEAEAVSDWEEPAEEKAMSRLQREAVREALRGLPEQQLQAVVASYYGAKTHSEMASSWNVPLGTVKSWVRYGLHNVRRQLEKRGWAGDRDHGTGEVRK
ncbi:sigma-70 family RNA polymerase sigma factor [Paenibacillus sacheonensis]|uniref:Sigma-70 family RNA polymerase sigma factor n=1 Tax=Paenibacillus sacheonensis TaxID=742054 RepID=A0A7X5BUV7_9BACL|nr:sigma-70 family RNA polymerase sigma factor [Paenibacillus sacheonensis]MBM7563864.1 RNA polymerase sigma-70 factor (ECF subfamily) [Paenibacillus sacheonensis]NBC67788.1 sigma-70 family RNA polymerase sigma factor [Paenibacillus sacheonensis]